MVAVPIFTSLNKVAGCDRMKDMKKIIVVLSALIIAVPAYAGTSMFDRGPSEESGEPETSVFRITNAEQAFVSGDYTEVVRLGNTYLARKPKHDEEIRCLVGRALLKLKRTDEARTHFMKILDTSENKKFLAEADIGIADSYYLDEEYRQARDYYEKAARHFPDSDNMHIVYYRLGECYSKLDNEPMAKEYYDKLRRLYPDSLEAKLIKGEGSGVMTYSVQAGAFSKMENAEKLREELKENGFDASIQTVTVEGSPFYRVRVGSYSRLSDAEDMARSLQDKGYTVKVNP